jgi:hypothetical protein
MKAGTDRLMVTAPGEAYGLAVSVSEALPGVGLLAREGEPLFKWSQVVESMQELWPVQYLLPGGAYVR